MLRDIDLQFPSSLRDLYCGGRFPHNHLGKAEGYITKRRLEVGPLWAVICLIPNKLLTWVIMSMANMYVAIVTWDDEKGEYSLLIGCCRRCFRMV